MAQARRQISQQNSVWRQILLPQVALKVVASNQIAAQAALLVALPALVRVLGA